MILLIGGCGYVGSALYPALSANASVQVMDICRRGNPSGFSVLVEDYGNIKLEHLRHFDTIILLAAHSSVGQAVGDPGAAFHNNVVKFHRLLEMLQDHQRLIYASSSSIYSGFGASAASENPEAGNLYDLSKYIDDALAALSGKQTYGLRFGTVNGPSPNIRNDLMLNRMVQSALVDHCVQIQNPQVHRPILGIRDLVRAVQTIVDGDRAPGIYNLASFNATVYQLGYLVAELIGVPYQVGEDTKCYDFEIETTKFEKTYDFEFLDTIQSIVMDLVESANGSNG